MSTTKETIHFEIKIDNANLNRQLKQSRESLIDTGKVALQQASIINGSLLGSSKKLSDLLTVKPVITDDVEDSKIEDTKQKKASKNKKLKSKLPADEGPDFISLVNELLTKMKNGVATTFKGLDPDALAQPVIDAVETVENSWNNIELSPIGENAQKNSVDKYAEFTQKYLALASEFEASTSNLETDFANKRAAIEGGKGRKKDKKAKLVKFDENAANTLAGVRAVQDEVLTGLDEEMNIKNEVFVSFIEGMVDVNLDKLVGALELVKSALEEETKNGLPGENTEQLNQYITTLKAQIVALNKEKSKKPVEPTEKVASSKKWTATLKIMGQVEGMTNDILKNCGKVSDTTQMIVSSSFDIVQGTFSMIEGISKLSDSAVAGTVGAASAGVTTIKSLESASVILGIISTAIQMATIITNMIVGMVTKNKDADNEKIISDSQVQIDGLKVSYDELSKSIESAFSSDAANLMEQQQENLALMNEQIEKQKKAEKEKKKPDTKAVEDYDKQIAENNKLIAESKVNAENAIFGEDIESAIDKFASAYMDAWASGEDRAKSQKDVVKNMIRGIVQEMVKSNIGKTIQEVRDKIEAAMEDGVVTKDEEDEIETAIKAANDKNDTYTKPLERFLVDEKSQDDEKSLSGQIRGSIATEQSVSELGGIFRGQWDTAKAMQTEAGSCFTNIADIAKVNGLIQANTLRTADNTDGLIAELRSMKAELNNITNNTKPTWKA